MADDINWGILSQIPGNSGIQKATPMAEPAQMAPSARAPDPNSGVDAMKGAADTMFANQANQRANQENQRANQLQPGLLQQQLLTNQGLGLDNQLKVSNLQATQYQIQVRQQAAQAYQQAKVKGGPQAGYEAAADAYAKAGDIDSAQKISETVQDIQKKMDDNDVTAVAQSGSAVYGIMKQEVPPTPATAPQKDPKTGQIIPGNPGNPGKTALQIYSEQYPELKKHIPNLPDPKSFRDNDQFKSTFVQPTLELTFPAQQQVAAQQKTLTDNALYQAQTVEQQARQDLMTIIKTKGANSPEAKAAAVRLQQAQAQSRNAKFGGGWGGGLVNTYKSLAPKWAGGDESANDLIKDNSPEATTNTQSPQSSQQQKQQYIEGQVYQDANGNKATYHNGQWVEQPK